LKWPLAVADRLSLFRGLCIINFCWAGLTQVWLYSIEAGLNLGYASRSRGYIKCQVLLIIFNLGVREYQKFEKPCCEVLKYVLNNKDKKVFLHHFYLGYFFATNLLFLMWLVSYMSCLVNFMSMKSPRVSWPLNNIDEGRSPENIF